MQLLCSILLGTAAAALLQTADAQTRTTRPRTERPSAPSGPRVAVAGGSDARAVLGITVSTSGSARDTLGLLINSVTRGGPADRAGISEGNRIAEINGIRLRLYPGDVGHPEAGDLLIRRLTAELRRIRAGDDITLRVYADGRYRTVTVPTGDAPTVAARASERVAPDDTERVSAPSARASEAQRVGQAEQATPSPAGEPERENASTLDGVNQALTELQSQLRRLLQDEAPAAVRRTLTQAEQQIADLQRQFMELAAEQRRQAEIELAKARQAELEAAKARQAELELAKAAEERQARRVDDAAELSGLRLTTVSEELGSYFGAGSERGLLVLEADASWEPIRPGDVILRANGMRVYGIDRLRRELNPRQENTVEVLRKGRSLTLTIAPRDR